MRELFRHESKGVPTTSGPGSPRAWDGGRAEEKVEIARAGIRDTCVRVLFEASAPILARLVDGDGNVLASTRTSATTGVLGERGPVCVRKGDAVVAVAIFRLDGTEAREAGAASALGGGRGSATTVRWIAWGSP